jgi:hypothetical protein
VSSYQLKLALKPAHPYSEYLRALRLDARQQIEATQNETGDKIAKTKSTGASRLQEIERLTNITEVPELMEEAHKDKTWILEHIRIISRFLSSPTWDLLRFSKFVR